jgi:hypothetical protein
MPKQGFITLYFNAEDFEREMGDGSKLDDAMLADFGKDMNEQAAHLLGYEGWVSGWTNLPDKVLTGGDYTDQAMALARTAYCHLNVNKDGKLTGIVCDKVSGTELDVGVKPDEEGVERFYANDDEGVYYYGDTLAQALSLAYDSQRQF